MPRPLRLYCAIKQALSQSRVIIGGCICRLLFADQPKFSVDGDVRVIAKERDGQSCCWNAPVSCHFAFVKLQELARMPILYSGQDERLQNLQSGKGCELITRPAQPSKTLFNIKKSQLLHDPYPNHCGEEWRYTERNKTRGIFAFSIGYFQPSNPSQEKDERPKILSR